MSEESTTPDLVELTRRSYEYASERNWGALLSLYGPDSVWDMSPLGLGTYEGPAATRRFFEEWTASYENYRIEPEEILELGNGVVFARVRQGGRPAGSSGDVSLLYAAVVVWKEGIVARLTNYTNIDEARAAAERLAEERG
jgi:ketosteroid isomerase-like protein